MKQAYVRSSSLSCYDCLHELSKLMFNEILRNDRGPLKRLGNIQKVSKYFLDFNSTLKYQAKSQREVSYTINFRLQTPGSYIFLRGFRRPYKRKGFYPRGLINRNRKSVLKKFILILIKIRFAFTGFN